MGLCSSGRAHLHVEQLAIVGDIRIPVRDVTSTAKVQQNDARNRRVELVFVNLLLFTCRNRCNSIGM